METLRHDLRFALRTLARAPGFTLVAVLTLALGVGANTAIFSVVHDVVLAPLPYPASDRLVRVTVQRYASEELLDALAAGTPSLDAISGYSADRFSLLGLETPTTVVATRASGAHFAVLGASPRLGRALVEADSAPGSPPVAILSHGCWQRRFGGDPNIIGRTIDVDGGGAAQRTVVGVMGPDFVPLQEGTEVWAPIVLDAANPDLYRDFLYLRLIARLGPGVEAARASAEVRAVAAAQRELLPDYYSESVVRGAGVAPLQQALVAPVRPVLLTLLGAVGFVLLIACANVANMLLARAGGRQRELAVRAALGAGRWRVMRQLITESAVVGLAGGATGVLVAVWTEGYLVAGLPAAIPRAGSIAIDHRELLFAALLSVVAVVVFGLVPALRATRPAALETVHRAGRAGAGARHRHRLNRALVTAEVALTLALVAAAGLMLKSLWRLQQVDHGFRADTVLALSLAPPGSRYTEPNALVAWADGVKDALAAVPGVASVGAIDRLPLTPGNMMLAFAVDGVPPPEGRPWWSANVRTVVPGYFASMAIPTVAGRLPDARDHARSAPVGVINRALAQTLWPGEDAVGRAIKWDTGDPWFTVAGVVGDVRQQRVESDPQPEIYLPHSQSPAAALTFTVRGNGEPMALARAVQRAVWTVDDQVPITALRPVSEVVHSALANPRFLATLLGVFGALALALGAVGIYGVASYAISQQTFEIGIRMALGARRGTVLRDTMVRAMGPVALGLVLGLIGVAAGGRLLAGSLYGVAVSDPPVLAAVAAGLALVAVLASFLPARRAAGVDPVIALRAE